MPSEKSISSRQSANVRSLEQLGNALRRFRKLQKISQVELAKKAGLTQKTISVIERDGKGTIATLLLILSALKLDLNLIERPSKKQDDLDWLL